MKIEIKGHSGCQIDVVNENNDIFVYKSTADSKYLNRLVLQAEKQRTAAEIAYPHIRVPKIYDIDRTETTVTVKMQYVYSKNFIEFFEQAGFEQIDYLIGAIKYFIEYEISQSNLQSVPASIFQNKFREIKQKCKANPLFETDQRIISILTLSEKIFANLQDIQIPVGLCHGDLTFSNILFNGNNYYLIDFLDSFIETPLQDIVKIRQDTQYRWSQLMYTKQYDAVRLHIILDKIDHEINSYFNNKYPWYSEYYQIMQLMNILRILPYAREEKVIEFLKDTLEDILNNINNTKYSNDGLNEKSVMYTETTDSKYSLVVPVAAMKPEYENGLPYVFGLDSDGIIICIKSIMGLDLKEFDHIYFTILKQHDEKFFIKDTMQLQFKRLEITNAKVVVLEEPTQDQAETIYQTVVQENIKGAVFIKDADCFFKANITQNNAIAIYPIEELDILPPKDKSYAAIDDMYYLTNIIEKKVVGHYISAGGYEITNIELFNYYYNHLRGYGKLYLSHIIYAMLLDKISFRPIKVDDYKDWGTRKDLNRYE